MSRNIWSDGLSSFGLCRKHMSVSWYPKNRSYLPTTSSSSPLSSSPPSPLQNEKSPKIKNLKKRTKKKNLFSTLHSQPYIIYHIPYTLPSRNVTQNPLPPLPPCISATATRKKVRHTTCSVTYLTTRVKKLHLHLHLQGQWTTLIRNFFIRLLF